MAAALIVGLVVVLVSAITFLLSSRKEASVPAKSADHYGAVVKDVDGTLALLISLPFPQLPPPSVQPAARF